MRRLLAGVVALFLTTALAFAQSGVSIKQSGSSVTPNTVPYWVTNGVQGDSVTAADSPVTTFGVTSSGMLGLCDNSARQSSGAWIGMCFGYVSGVPTISVQNYGAASAQPLQFIVNGTTFPFPGSLASITIGNTPVISGTNGDCLSISSAVVSQVPCQILSAGTTGTGPVVLQNSPTLSGTIGGTLTFSGNETFSGNVSMGSQLIINGVSTPASASQQSVVMGTISAPLLTNTGQAWLFNTAVGGANLQGDGSSQDITLLNKSGTPVMQVATGSTGITFPGVLTLSGLSSGTCASSVLLDSSNHTITGSCPGAASSIQVGTTTISSGTNANILYDNAGTLGNNTIASFLTAGTGISISGTTNATIALTTPVSAANGGSGNSSPTSHGLLAGEGSSAFNSIGPGTLGQFDAAQGASADPAFVAGPFTLLATLTASNSTSLSDTSHFTSTYSEYEIVFENLIAATNNVSCEIQVHSGGSFQATSYLTNSFVPSGTGIISVNPTTQIPCSNTSAALNTAPGVNGRLYVSSPATSALHVFHGQFASNAISVQPTVGVWNSAAAVDGFQFLFSSGNITSGVIKIYGRL